MTLSALQVDAIKADIIKDFFAHDVIKINTKELFTLSSGIKLPLYLDHRRIFSFPHLRAKVIQVWANMLEEKMRLQQDISLQNNKNIVFSGTATAGIAPAYGLSSYFESGFIYVRDKSKGYGLKSQIEGDIAPNNKFIVIDDMVVTGSSLLKNGLVLKELFGSQSILCATSISCHESVQMRQTFVQNAMPYFPLFTTYEIFNIAHKANVIDAQTFQIIMECLETFDKKS